jgi:soluble lytic murein transglycosylase-like protein
MRLLFLCLCALPAIGGEYAILSNGFRVYADRHEKRGDIIRLETRAGVTELPADSIQGFEVEESMPPVPKPAVPEPAHTAAAPVGKSPQELVEAAAHKAGLPPAIVHAIAKAESGYRQDAVSRKGAIGVMQLMPETAKELQADPHDLAQNVEAGAMYLRDLLVRYEGDPAKAVAAYNAGPGAVDKYGDVPPYRETRSYVSRVLNSYKQMGGE